MYWVGESKHPTPHEMQHSIHLFLFLLISSSLPMLTLAKPPKIDFSFPESAAFDPENNRCYISNFNGNYVLEIDDQGHITVFGCTIKNPLGMLIHGDFIYVISNPNTIKGYDKRTAEETLSLQLPSAQFLNDLTIDDQGYLYATDSRTGVIFKINVEEKNSMVLCNTGFKRLNGIAFDPKRKRLVCCSFCEQGSVGTWNLSTGKFSKINRFIAANLDGISIDDSDNLYFSSWGSGDFSVGFNESAGTVIKINADLTGDPSIIESGHHGPADLFYDSINHRLIIPNALSNTVDFVKL